MLKLIKSSSEDSGESAVESGDELLGLGRKKKIKSDYKQVMQQQEPDSDEYSDEEAAKAAKGMGY